MLVAGLAPASSAAAQQGEGPSPAALRVQYQVSPNDDQFHRLLRLRTDGDPPAERVTLTAADGDHHAMASPVAAGRCTQEPVRVISSGRDEWCIELSGLDPATSVSGTLAGSATKVALVVDSRHQFLGLPGLIVLLAFVIGALLALSMEEAQSSAHKRVLDGLSTRLAEQFTGVPDWLETVKASVSTTDLIADIQLLLGHGTAAIDAARRHLDATEQTSPLAVDHPLRVRCREEAVATTYDIGELRGPAGAATSTTAGTLQTALASAATWTRRLATLDAAAATLGVDAAVATVLANAHKALDAYEPGTEADMETAFAIAQELLTQRAAMGKLTAASFKPLAEPTVLPTAAKAPRKPGAAALRWARIRPWLLTVGVTGVLVVVGIGVAYATTYAPVTTFGSFDDYVKLFAAALIGTTVASVSSLVLLWRPLYRSAHG